MHHLPLCACGRNFAVALAETPQFKAFERAYDALSHDTAAQESITAYQAKVDSLRALLMLDAVSEAERAELEQLKQAYLHALLFRPILRLKPT